MSPSMAGCDGIWATPMGAEQARTAFNGEDMMGDCEGGANPRPLAQCEKTGVRNGRERRSGGRWEERGSEVSSRRKV